MGGAVIKIILYFQERDDRMNFFTTNDKVNIYYQVNGQGTPIIFIHGFAESGDVFRIQKRALAKKYKVVTYDIRGHGKSDIGNSPLNINRLSRDLQELIIGLDLQDVVLVGWSMGASVLLEYIKNFATSRLKKIVIVDKGPKLLNDKDWKLGLVNGKYDIESLNEDLKLLKEDFPQFARKFTSSICPDLNEREVEMGVEKVLKNSPDLLYCLWKSMSQSDHRDILPKIDVGTLLVFAGKNTLYSMETGQYMRDNIKGSRLEIFHENSHLLVLENPRRFNGILDDFIGD